MWCKKELGESIIIIFINCYTHSRSAQCPSCVQIFKFYHWTRKWMNSVGGCNWVGNVGKAKWEYGIRNVLSFLPYLLDLRFQLRVKKLLKHFKFSTWWDFSYKYSFSTSFLFSLASLPAFIFLYRTPLYVTLWNSVSKQRKGRKLLLIKEDGENSMKLIQWITFLKLRFKLGENKNTDLRSRHGVWIL